MNTRYKEDVQRLFEFWCEISPSDYGDKNAGNVVSSFPETFKDDEILAKLPEFAYPCPFTNDSIQTYSFILTSSDSKWRFGFCRHDSKSCTAMVLISYLPWHDTFIKFLNVLGELKKSNNGEFIQFLSEAYLKGVPQPGASLKLFYNAGVNNFMFQRPSQFVLPSIPENHNLNVYYNFVDPKNMIAVFAAMLAERRIVFTSRRLDKLSSCVQAANAFLYPMVWQHIFIPILPKKMKEILCAPMPFLIGVPEAVLEVMTPDELGDVVIFNCDNRTLESTFDDVKSMPQELVSQLKKNLSNSNEHIGDRVSKIFLGILVQLIGGYRDAIKFTQGEKITWDKDTFIDSRSPSLRPFLRNMMELQIFQQFIEERLEMLNTGLGFSDEFELETLRHLEKSGKRVKNYKEFLKNVKDKTNPAVKSAMQSVKQGSRGVKTAYKDLKSKIRDKTSPISSHYTDYVTSSNDVGHHSTPNSPVFSKRGEISHDKPQAMLQSSNSLMKSSHYTNNNNIDKNSAIRIPNSNSYSDMNILQELQQHALFKTPAVDRSLKPANSMDYSTLKSVRSGLLKNTPIYKQQYQDVTAGKQCMLYEIPHHPPPPSVESFNSSSESSTFDSPPEMFSPPVPPRVLDTTHNKHKTDVSPMSFSMSFENNFVNSDLFSVPTIPSAHNKSIVDTSTNLISLDTNTSFELEDFDPLNQNAKPIPEPTSIPYLSTNHIQDISNPVYHYCSPNHQFAKKKNIQNYDDVELLRKYGLDQFSLVECGESDFNRACSSQTNSSSSKNLTHTTTHEKNNWTVFE